MYVGWAGIKNNDDLCHLTLGSNIQWNSRQIDPFEAKFKTS